MTAKDCSNLHPLVHLGDSLFLATTATLLPLSSGCVSFHAILPSLIWYQALINAHNICQCPFLFLRPCQSNLCHGKLLPPLPLKVGHGQTVIAELDSTLHTLDGQLTNSLLNVNDHIDTISTETAMGPTDFITGFALDLRILSCFGLTLFVFYNRQHGIPLLQHGASFSCAICRCRRAASAQPNPCK